MTIRSKTGVGGKGTPRVPPSTGGGHLIEDEGVPLPQQPTLNFVGAGVTATDGPGAVTTVTIPGGAASAYDTIQEEGVALPQQTTLNFIGEGLTAADDALNNRTNVTISNATNLAGGTVPAVGAVGTIATSTGAAVTWTAPNLYADIQESFVATDGQVNFTLSQAPATATSTMMFVGGVKQDYGTDYGVVGNIVTYDGDPVLVAGTLVEFYYVYTTGPAAVPPAKFWTLVPTLVDYPVPDTADYLISVGAIAAPISITLPAVPAVNQWIQVCDSVGSASTFNITINGNGFNVRGNPTLVLTADYSAATLVFDGTVWMLL